MSDMPVLTVYSRRGCHLCEDLLGELEPLVSRRARLRVCDVDTDEALRSRYGPRVPVVCAGDEELCHFHLDRRAVLNWLDGAPPPAPDHS